MEGGKLVLLLSLLSLFLLPSMAQFFGLAGLPPCVPVLSPCLVYLHTESPPPSCCIPLENALEDQADCLCAAFKNKSLLDKIKMTQDEMLKFPGKCGLTLPDNANCSAVLSTSKVSPAPTPTVSKAEPTSSPPAPSDESGANAKSLQGFSVLFSAVILPIIAAFHV